MNVQSKYVTEEVITTIRHKIIRGQLKPGQRLVERDLAVELGVSRTPVREAIRCLASEGLVEIIYNKGAVVTSLELNDMKYLYEIRAVLEGLAGRMATRSITDSDLRELTVIQKRIQLAAEQQNYKEVNSMNTEFHFRLYSIVPYGKLPLMIKELWNNAKRMRATTLSLPLRAPQVVREHERILLALEDRNEIEVENLIRDHVMNALRALIEAEEKHFINVEL